MGKMVHDEGYIKEFWKIIREIYDNLSILKKIHSRIKDIDKISKIFNNLEQKIYDLWTIKDSIYRLAQYDIGLKKMLIKINDDFIRKVNSIDIEKISETYKLLQKNEFALYRLSKKHDDSFLRLLSLLTVEHVQRLIDLSKIPFGYSTIRKINEMPSQNTLTSFLNTSASLETKYHNIISMQNKLEKQLYELREERKRIIEASKKLKIVEKLEEIEFVFEVSDKNNMIKYDKENNKINVRINKKNLPKGEKGEDGVGLKFDIVGLAKNLYLYNSQPRGFSYLAHDVPCIYIKLNEKPNNWSRPIKLEFVND